MTDQRPVVSEVSGAAGPDVPDERESIPAAVLAVLDKYDVTRVNAFWRDALRDLVDVVDAEVAAAVSGCRRDQQAAEERIVEAQGTILQLREAWEFYRAPLRVPPVRNSIAADKYYAAQTAFDTCLVGLAQIAAALAGEVNPE